MDATLFSNRVEFTELGNAITLAGSDILRGEVVKVPVPNVPGNAVTFVRLFLCGDAREAYGEYYDVDFRNLANQPTWTDRVDTVGAFTCLTDLTPIFRKPISTGGGGGQVDTVTGGTATFVDATDPVNLISNVLVDGVTIGVNGLNQLEVPAGGGGYVPTIRTINTTAPLTGGGNLSANRTIGIPQANGSTDGFLDSSDWTTFNDKGDVDGPGSAVDDDIALFDGITGKLIKSAGINLTEVVEGSGFGDASLIESTGASPIILKDVKDGDGTTVQSNTGSFQINVEAKNSVEVDAGEVQLVGDDAAPGNSEYYGTDGSGTKGFHALPAPTGAALTRTDDTNVTLTLGGSPSTALLAAASITAGWTGQLSIARGGTNAATEAAALTNLGILRTSLTSAFVTDSASFVDVTGMSLTVPAGKTAKFTFYVPYSSAATTVGIGLSMTVTGSPLLRHFTRFTPTNVTGTPVRAMITTDDGGAVNASTGAASTKYGIEMNGVVVADASPCVVQLRMSVGGTPANITLAAGSVMMATLID